ncbi:uncharacterized protein CELE_W06G6.10 [Caenorhabditis elegans]|uniref:Uncharacterized protein n=1 Tax=Caenorhabditis elegans TaxID=6239 RepID=Q9U341_CAEEL|nr:Uncharacterized protein CELE_W06G6.10 [Caenorhabditis elegans]CAB63324.1 Uncharacterized protein CELE_W06G6.10 [Caenorhabditis elegans]|eukprot:NP_507213.1 Uncharacterized protein CELE_W06G6.10 [Caenorhabditis elegans]
MEFGRNPLSMTSTKPTLLNVLDDVGEAALHAIPKVDDITSHKIYVIAVQPVSFSDIESQAVKQDASSPNNCCCSCMHGVLRFFAELCCNCCAGCVQGICQG